MLTGHFLKKRARPVVQKKLIAFTFWVHPAGKTAVNAADAFAFRAGHFRCPDKDCPGLVTIKTPKTATVPADCGLELYLLICHAHAPGPVRVLAGLFVIFIQITGECVEEFLAGLVPVVRVLCKALEDDFVDNLCIMAVL